MATTVNGRPDWLPDGYEHVQVTREEIWEELDREARRLFAMTADEFLQTYRHSDSYEKYAGDPRFNSLSNLADLIAEPAQT